MGKELIKAQDVFLNKVNQICGKFGLNNIMAQLYAILYFSDKPLSLDDMVDRLKISKGSASINIRALEHYNVVRRIWVKGSRKDYYEAEKDIEKVIIERITSMVNNRLSEIDEMINSSYAGLDAINSDNVQEDAEMGAFKEKLERIKTLYTEAHSIFELFKANVLAGRQALKNGTKKDATGADTVS